jgi:hypothetical protein
MLKGVYFLFLSLSLSLSIRRFLFSSSRVLQSNCRLAHRGSSLLPRRRSIGFILVTRAKSWAYTTYYYMSRNAYTKGVKAGCDHLLTSVMPLRDTIQATPILTHRMMRLAPETATACSVARPPPRTGRIGGTEILISSRLCRFNYHKIKLLFRFCNPASPPNVFPWLTNFSKPDMRRK